jgi:hypothetical protein
MTLIMSTPNRTLKGHKLLVLSPMPVAQHLVDQLKSQFPDLEIVNHTVAWGVRDTSHLVSEEEWKGVTILATGTGLPEKGQAPNLQYVQLFSAGANQVLGLPLFKESDIVFCTANGVHGYVQSYARSHGDIDRSLTMPGPKYQNGLCPLSWPSSIGVSSPTQYMRKPDANGHLQFPCIWITRRRRSGSAPHL